MIRCLALAALLLALPVPRAAAQDGGDAIAACYGVTGTNMATPGAKACRNLQQFLYGTNRFCRRAAPPEVCATADGRLVSAGLVAAYAQSWVPRALALQRGLDDDVPLVNELWTHTHNSFNAEAYDPTFSGLDPNQVYSLSDQLTMGIRAIEIDLHWAPSPYGLPEDGFKAPIVCHGSGQGISGARVHIGCTTEVHVRTRLHEVRTWLDAHPDDVVMIYLENQMDGDPTAHLRASEAIEAELGDVVYRPASDGACHPLPFDTTRAQFRTSGRRVLLTGNCGPGAWTSWVFERGPHWDEHGDGNEIYPPYPDCIAAERQPLDYDHTWIRRYEDSTWLSAMVDGTGLGGTGTITPDEARSMVRCGVDMPGFDQLRPFDPRMEALVWSWAPDEPSGGRFAVESGGRFYSSAGAMNHPFACRTATGWTVTAITGDWFAGEPACTAIGASFDVPRTGYDNELLKAANTGGADVWLAYRDDAGWRPVA
jgi:hypothetical protein